MSSQVTTDHTLPSLDYSYLSDCSKVIFSSCDQGTWTIEARAKDTDSGNVQCYFVCIKVRHKVTCIER